MSAPATTDARLGQCRHPATSISAPYGVWAGFREPAIVPAPALATDDSGAPGSKSAAMPKSRAGVPGEETIDCASWEIRGTETASGDRAGSLHAMNTIGIHSPRNGGFSTPHDGVTQRRKWGAFGCQLRFETPVFCAGQRADAVIAWNLQPESQGDVKVGLTGLSMRSRPQTSGVSKVPGQRKNPAFRALNPAGPAQKPGTLGRY